MMYPPLPTVAPPTSDDTAYSYGMRVLTFLLATDCTATVSTEDLELAEHVSCYAVASRDISPVALKRISDIRHVIALVLRSRKDAIEVPIGCTTPKEQDKPNLGPMAKRIEPQPVQPSPSERVKVDIAF